MYQNAVCILGPGAGNNGHLAYLLRTGETPLATLISTGSNSDVIQNSQVSAKYIPDPPRLDEWRRYLDQLNKKGANQAVRLGPLFSLLRNQLIAGLALPDAELTDDGNVLLWWDSRDWHVEMEVHPDGAFEWYARDRRDESVYGSDGDTVEAPPLELLEKLRAICSES